MSCNLCGSLCQGRICAECRRLNRQESMESPDWNWYECPDCGDELSTREGRLCYRCRDDAERGSA